MTLIKFESLVTWLKDNERSKSWLARHIQVSPSLMNLMLSGKRTMSEYHKNNICFVIEMKPDELFPE